MNTDTEKLLIAEHAAEWLIRLETATAEERAAFWQWLTQSPLHVKEMIAAGIIDAELRRAMSGGSIDVSKYLQQTNNVRAIDNHAPHDEMPGAPDSEVVASRAASCGSKRARWIIAAAAFFIVVFTAAALVLHESSQRRIVTEAGEWQTRRLSDTTIVQVGPRTKLHIEFSNERRLVRLVRGEALFHVAKNPDRPFFVETPLASARAVGTAFAVTLDGEKEVRVTVKEGVVAVTRRSYSQTRRKGVNGAGQAVTLNASEQVTVDATNSLTAERVNVDAALAWVEHRLIFEHETVEQAVREFNRRNELQIKVLDPTLLQRAVRGIFDATDPKTFATYLEKQGDVSHQRVVSMLDEESGMLVIAPYPPK